LVLFTTKWKGILSILSFKLTLMFGCAKRSLTTSTWLLPEATWRAVLWKNSLLPSWHWSLDGPSTEMRLQRHDQTLLHQIISFPQNLFDANQVGKEGRKREMKGKFEWLRMAADWPSPYSWCRDLPAWVPVSLGSCQLGFLPPLPEWVPGQQQINLKQGVVARRKKCVLLLPHFSLPSFFPFSNLTPANFLPSASPASPLGSLPTKAKPQKSQCTVVLKTSWALRQTWIF